MEITPGILCHIQFATSANIGTRLMYTTQGTHQTITNSSIAPHTLRAHGLQMMLETQWTPGRTISPCVDRAHIHLKHTPRYCFTLQSVKTSTKGQEVFIYSHSSGTTVGRFILDDFPINRNDSPGVATSPFILITQPLLCLHRASSRCLVLLFQFPQFS